MSNSDRGPKRRVRTYLGHVAQTTGRAVLECGHERAVPKNAQWYYCGACRGAPDTVSVPAREVIELPVRDGDPIQLVRVVDILKIRGGRNARKRFFLSDGSTVEGNSRYELNQIARGELVRKTAENISAQVSLRHYGEAFVRAWLNMPNFPRANVAEKILSVAGFTDMPAEALHTWLSKAARRYFNDVSRDYVIDAVVIGGPSAGLLALTVGDVLRSAVRQQSEGLDRGYHVTWYEPVVAAIARWLRTQNLVEPDLSDPSAFGVSIADVWRWDCLQRDKADGRAARLRSAIAERFGFKRATLEERYGARKTVWIRADFDVPDDFTFTDVKSLKEFGKSVVVTDDLTVYVCGQHRCVVEAKSADLPHDDQVARRMLAVATTHREEISTLKGDLALLEELFTPYRGAKVWDLACAEEDE